MNDKFINVIESIRSKLRPNQYIYHGTGQSAGSSIQQQGFRPSTTGKMGPGVYATNNPDYARFYGQAGTAFSTEKPVLLRGRMPADVLDRGLAQKWGWENYPRQIMTSAQMGDARTAPVKGNELVFRNPEEANEAFSVGGRKNREALQSALKVFTTLKMLQHPLSQLGQKLGKQIWASRGKPNAARMSLMGGNAPTYSQ